MIAAKHKTLSTIQSCTFFVLNKTEIQHKFNLKFCQELVYDWDRRLLPVLKGVEKVDRLAIIVTFHGIPEIPTSLRESKP